MGQQLFRDDPLAAGAHHNFGVPLGGVDAPDLGGLHVDGGPLLQVDDGLGIHDALAGALALAVVLLHIAHLGVLPHVEGMHTVVLAGLTAGIVDAAAGDDVHIAVRAHVKIVVDQVVQAGLGDDDRDVDRLVFGARSDVNVDARLVGLGVDDDVGGVGPPVQPPVLPDVVGPHRGLFQVCDLLEELPVHVVHFIAPSFI